jgi:hypothetical protein
MSEQYRDGEQILGGKELDISGDTILIRTTKTPAASNSTGTKGQIAWDTGYIYICTATDTWERVAIATW